MKIKRYCCNRILNGMLERWNNGIMFNKFVKFLYLCSNTPLIFIYYPHHDLILPGNTTTAMESRKKSSCPHFFSFRYKLFKISIHFLNKNTINKVNFFSKL